MSLKIVKTLSALSFIIIAAAVAVSAQFLYPSSLPRVSTPWGDAVTYDTVLLSTWHGIRERNVRAYSTGMVHRPKSNFPDDAVSEGISYGMLLALYCNDQAYFNSIWEGGERYMWNETDGLYDWRRDVNGNANYAMGEYINGPASDADQDIALLLIFADELVKAGIWRPYGGPVSAGYAGRARRILATIRGTMIARGRYLKPGQWGDEEPGTINPGYFAPAFYRVFAEFEPEYKRVWEALIDGSYELIAKSPGYERGLLPDWCNFEGGSTGGAGYNAYFDGDALYRDAIRVYWRLATDYLWYGERRAKAFLDNAIDFLEGGGGASKANFFDMDGNLLPAEDVEVLGDGVRVNITRTRREHSHLTMGMWAAASMARGTGFAQAYGNELLKFYEPGTDYWGHAVDPSGGTEDTLRNEMYFDQFLAWFGASVLGGVFTNVWDDLKDGIPLGPPSWKTRPPALLENWDINASEEPFRFGASFSHAARWIVEFRHDATGSTSSFSDNSDSVNVVWYGMAADGSYMPQGWYTLTLTAGGLEYTTKVWLGRPFSNRPDLMVGNRLLIDDFADGDVYPYIGSKWAVHTDADNDQGNSSAEITFVPSGGGNRLRWSYTLDRPNWQFAALDWETGGLDFSNGVVDTLIVTASSQKAGLRVSVQLVSADFNIPHEYQFYEHWIELTTSPQTFRMPLNTSEFAQRHNGSGKDFQTTLAGMNAVRFHVQYDPGQEGVETHSSGAIILDEMYLAGRNIGNLYQYDPPPDYIDPPGPPDIVRAVNRAAARNRYSIRKSAGVVRITLPQSMAGASVRVVDIRGRSVRQLNVPMDGRVDIRTRGLAAGMYIAEIRKPGVSSIRAPITISR